MAKGKEKPKHLGKKSPPDVLAISKQIVSALNTADDHGRRVGDARCGIYAFYDYDGEPIYVGQTKEKLRTRIRRHLTNQRTDAVAMNVLDPFEVAEIEMWPLWELESLQAKDAKLISALNRAEYTIYEKLRAASIHKAVLNEKIPQKAAKVKLSASYRVKIIPDDIRDMREHADVRIARRANTIASLARVISERDVEKGLRRTLLTQAKRLEHLANRRLTEAGGEYEVEKPGEETGGDVEG